MTEFSLWCFGCSQFHGKHRGVLFLDRVWVCCKVDFVSLFMGRQTSQYSLCISVTQFTFYMSTLYFLYGQLEFLYGQLEFLYGQLFTFYMVSFLLFISVCVKRGLKGKMQTDDCRLGVKCRIGFWRINCLWPRYRPDREAQERSVECLEASDTKHHSKITPTFAAQNKGTRNRCLLSK